MPDKKTEQYNNKFIKRNKMENTKTKKNVGINTQATEEKKYTEAELNAACGQLYQKLMKEIQVRDMTNMFKRMDYLFKVIENKNCFSDDFVQECIDEIEVALTPVEPEESEDTEEENA